MEHRERLCQACQASLGLGDAGQGPQQGAEGGLEEEEAGGEDVEDGEEEAGRLAPVSGCPWVHPWEPDWFQEGKARFHLLSQL